MRIGVPTEIKDNEYRVGMTPSGAAVLAADGHDVYVQSGAGNGSGFSDDEYRAAGAKIVGNLLYQALFDGYNQFKLRRVQERFAKAPQGEVIPK